MRSTRSHRPFRLIVIATLAVGAVTLAACSSGGSGSSATTAGGGSSANAASPAASATCPSASSLSAAAGTTFTGPRATVGHRVNGASNGATVCSYTLGGQVALMVILYPAGTSLKNTLGQVSLSHTTPASGLGGSAATFADPAGGTSVFVARTSAPSFSIIDEAFNGITLTTAQAIALAKAVIAQ